MSQQNLSSDSVSPESWSPGRLNCTYSVFPGRVMKVDKSKEPLTCDTTSGHGKHVLPQTSLNLSSEIRSRKKTARLRRGSSDLLINEQLEMVDMDSSKGSNHGHVFISASLSQPTWCDKCGDFIWGIYKQCLICTSTLTLSSS